MENLVVCNKCPVVAKNSSISKKPPSSPTSPLRHLRSFSSLFNRSVTLRMALPPSGQNPGNILIHVRVLAFVYGWCQRCTLLAGLLTVVEQQKVIISNKHGEKLVGLLHDTGSNEIVILCHGFRSTKVVCFHIWFFYLTKTRKEVKADLGLLYFLSISRETILWWILPRH